MASLAGADRKKVKPRSPSSRTLQAGKSDSRSVTCAAGPAMGPNQGSRRYMSQALFLSHEK